MKFQTYEKLILNIKTMRKSYKSKTVVITGGSGSIGRSIIKKLYEYDILNIDNIKPKKLLQNEIFLKFDLNNYKDIPFFLDDNIKYKKITFVL